MISPFAPNASFLSSAVWQMSILLLLGLSGSFFWARQPARAHRVLLLALIACFATPSLSLVVREFGWGLLPQRPTASEARTELPPPLSLTGPVERESDSSLFVKPSKTETVAPVQSESALIPSASIANPAVPLKEIFLWLWLAVSGMFVVRLLLSLLEGARLVAGAHPLEDEKIEQAVASAATELDLRTAPEVFRSNRVRCPLIWSWRHRPALLLPSSYSDRFASPEWRGIVCHEMAHLKRMDHFTRLLGEILICIVPWHPIAWWAKSRLGALSEKACDDWALANGQSPTDYAQLMLTLLPQTRPALALASVTSHRSLKGRIRHILRSTRSDPRLGRGWGWGVTFTAGCLVAAIAFS